VPPVRATAAPIDNKHALEQAERERRRAGLPAAEAAVLNAADRLKDTLHDIRSEAPQGDPGVIDQYNQRADQQQKDLAAAVKNWADSADSPAGRKKALDAMGDVDRLLPDTKKAGRKAAENPRDKEARKHLDGEVDKTHSALDRLMDAVNPGEALAATIAETKRDVAQVDAGAKAGDSPVVAAAAGAVGRRRGKLAEQAKAAAERADPTRSSDIAAAVAEVEKLLPRQVEAANKVLESPTPDTKKELSRRTTQVNDALNVLAHVGNPSPHERVAEAAEKVRALLDRVEKATAAGDTAGSAAAMKELDPALKNFQQLSKVLADQVKAPARRQEIQHALAALQPAHNALITDAPRAAANKDDANAQQKARQDIDALRHQLANVEGLLHAPAIAAAHRSDADTSRLASAHKDGDPKTVAAMAHSLVNRNAALTPLAEKAAADSADEPVRRKHILGALGRLQNLVPQLVAAAAERNDQQMDQAVADVHNAYARLTDAMNPCVAAEFLPATDDNDEQPRRKRVLDSLAALERILPVIASQANKVAANTHDADARSELKGTMNSINEPLCAVVVHFTRPEEQLAADLRDLGEGAYEAGDAAKRHDAPVLNELARHLAGRQAHLMPVARLTAERCDDPLKRKQILDSIGSLEKILPETLAASKTVFEKDAPDTRKKLNKAMAQYDENLEHLARLVNPSPEQRLVENAERLAKACAALQASAKKGDQKGTHALAENVKDICTQLAADARLEAGRTPFAADRTPLLEQARLLEDISRRTLPPAASAAAATPSDSAKETALAAEISRLLATCKKAVDLPRAPAIAPVHTTEQALAVLEGAAAAQDGPAAVPAAVALNDKQSKAVTAMRAASDQADDPVRRKQLLERLEELGKVMPESIAAAKGVASAPADPRSQRDMSDSAMRHKVYLHTVPYAYICLSLAGSSERPGCGCEAHQCEQDQRGCSSAGGRTRPRRQARACRRCLAGHRRRDEQRPAGALRAGSHGESHCQQHHRCCPQGCHPAGSGQPAGPSEQARSCGGRRRCRHRGCCQAR
jgi:hypothetical protein